MLLLQNGFHITYPGNMVCFRYVTVNTQYGDHHYRYYYHYYLLHHNHHHVACRVLGPMTCSGHINTLEVF